MLRKYRFFRPAAVAGLMLTTKLPWSTFWPPTEPKAQASAKATALCKSS